MSDDIRTRAIDRRRALHRYPEPAWREFYTTSRLVDYVEEIGVDEVVVGEDAMVSEKRLGVPDSDVLDEWRERARNAGAREDVLEATAGGHTGLLAVLERGPGPVVGLRVDIDALPFAESEGSDHAPVAEGFRAEHDDAMHACGHDAHMSMGLGVLEAIKASDFSGTFKLFFQPSEEILGGGGAMASTGTSTTSTDCSRCISGWVRRRERSSPAWTNSSRSDSRRRRSGANPPTPAWRHRTAGTPCKRWRRRSRTSTGSPVTRTI